MEHDSVPGVRRILRALLLTMLVVTGGLMVSLVFVGPAAAAGPSASPGSLLGDVLEPLDPLREPTGDAESTPQTEVIRELIPAAPVVSAVPTTQGATTVGRTVIDALPRAVSGVSASDGDAALRPVLEEAVAGTVPGLAGLVETTASAVGTAAATAVGFLEPLTCRIGSACDVIGELPLLVPERPDLDQDFTGDALGSSDRTESAGRYPVLSSALSTSDAGGAPGSARADRGLRPPAPFRPIGNEAPTAPLAHAVPGPSSAAATLFASVDSIPPLSLPDALLRPHDSLRVPASPTYGSDTTPD